MFADGFSVQRGKIFGFGPNSEDDTKNVLKISSVNGPNKRKLDKAPVTNLGYVTALKGNYTPFYRGFCIFDPPPPLGFSFVHFLVFLAFYHP